MPDAPKVIDRGALYYPFIHVRDEEWLKATLLCFPFIDRMVPAGYEVNDGDLAGYFASAQGRFGRPMLGRRDVGDPAIEHSRAELLAKLEEDLVEGDLAARFSRDAARTGDFADGENAFQIHEYKIGGRLLEFLAEHGLAWEPTLPVRGNARWWAVHPQLGEAIMSTNAVAIARANDLEIVTSNGPIHRALMGASPADVYDTLIRQAWTDNGRSETQKVNDLMRFVIISAFDVTKLSAADIAELNQNRSDLASLKAALLGEVNELPNVPDREAWNDLLAVRARDVIEEWGSRSSPLAMLSRANRHELASEFEGAVKEMAPMLVAGATTTALAGVLPGLAVGVIFGAGRMIQKWNESKKPYRYLSRMVNKGAQTRHVLEASPA